MCEDVLFALPSLRITVLFVSPWHLTTFPNSNIIFELYFFSCQRCWYLKKTHDVELWFIELQMLLGEDIWREVILVQPPTHSKTIANASLGQLELLAFKIYWDRLHLSGNPSWCPAWTCTANITGENSVLSALLLPPGSFRLSGIGLGSLCQTEPSPLPSPSCIRPGALDPRAPWEPFAGQSPAVPQL